MSSKISHHHAKDHTSDSKAASGGGSRWLNAHWLALFVLLVLATIIGADIYSENQDSQSQMKNKASLTLVPEGKKVSQDSVITMVVWVDSGNQPVNAVQANLIYPANKFGFVSVDSAGSAFEVEAQALGGGGVVNIARGHIGSVYGRQLVAKVNLKVKSNTGKAAVNFATGSAVIRTTDSVNILARVSGSNYRLVSLGSPFAPNQALALFSRMSLETFSN